MVFPLNPVPDEVYPSSSDKGEAIPLSAVRPIGCIEIVTEAADEIEVTLEEAINLISFTSTVDFTVHYGDSSVVGIYSARKFRGRADVIYELVLPSEFTVGLLGAGTIVGNVLQKWGQIRNIGSYSNS